MKTKFKLLLLLSALTIAALSTCKVNKITLPDSEVNIINTPQIIFLNYSIYRKSAPKHKVQFVNKIIANGELKMNSSEEFDYKTGDLKCIQLSENSISIDSLYISNPLRKVVEYADEFGQFSKKVIVLDSAQFSIRMQLDPNTEFIAIEQVDVENKINTNLIVTKIK